MSCLTMSCLTMSVLTTTRNTILPHNVCADDYINVKNIDVLDNASHHRTTTACSNQYDPIQHSPIADPIANTRQHAEKFFL